MNKIKKMLKSPRHFALGIISAMAPFIKSDEFYTKMRYWAKTGKSLNLKNPKTLNEKMQWLKLNEHFSERTQLVDKYEAKFYLKDRFGEEFIVPTLGVWDNANDIDFDNLPEKFVLKCNHNSGCVCICHDKSVFDKRSAIKKLNNGLKDDYYLYSREWPYRDVKRRVIAEKLLENKEGKIPNDYKFHFINGNLEFIYVSFDREGVNDRCMYDNNWQRLPFVWVPADSYSSTMNSADVPRPSSLDEMIRIGNEIAKDFKYIRVDFYDVDGKVYIGELTLYHGSGYDSFYPEKYNEIYGNKLKL